MSTKSSNASPRISHKETENRGQKLLKSILHKYSSSLSMVINVPGLPWVLAKQQQFLMNKFLVSRKGAITLRDLEE